MRDDAPVGHEPEPKAVELDWLGSRPVLAEAPVGNKWGTMAIIAAIPEAIVVLFDLLGLETVVIAGTDEGEEELDDEEAEGEGVEVVMHVL